MRGRGNASPHLGSYEQADDGTSVVQMDFAFLHDTGNKDAKVTFLTMVDNSSGQNGCNGSPEGWTRQVC